MATKKHIELQNAEDFYNKAQDYVRKIEKLDKDIAMFSVSRAEDPEKKEMYQEALTDLKEKYEGEKEMAEYNIKLAIAEYLKDAEKQQQKLVKNRDNYEKYIQEEQAKLDALKQEIDSLEGNEEQEDVLADKKEEYEELKLKLETKLEKLKGYDEKIAELKSEIEQAKVQYKDYIEMPIQDEVKETNKDIAEEQQAEVVADDKNNIDGQEKDDEVIVPEKAEENKDINEEKQTEKIVADKNNIEEQEKDDEVIIPENKEKKIEVPKDNIKETTPVNEMPDVKTYVVSENVDELDMSKTSEQYETDDEAFDRIYGLISKRKTRNSITSEDVDRMVEILSDKSNYDKFNIGTKRFLGLKIFPSKAEKIYKQLGNALSYDVYKVTKNKEVLSAQNRYELSDFDEIIDLGVRANEKTEIENSVDRALENAKSDKEKEQILVVKNRLSNYRKSMTALDEVMFNRGHLAFVNDSLPETKEPTDEVIVPNQEVFEEVKSKDSLSSLSKLVEENPTLPKVSGENTDRTMSVVISDGDIVGKGER